METNNTHISDSSLIRKCQSGNKSAFEMLTKRYYQKAYAMAIYWIHNRDTALDISQEAFVRIYRNIHRFEAEKSFPAWMYTIIKNLCRNYLQRHKKRWTVFSDIPAQENSSHAELSDTISAAIPVDEFMELDERKKMLWRAIHRLKAADREIIILKDIEEFSYKEISETLNIPAGSVMSRLYYARKKLAKLVKVEMQ